MTFFYNKQLKFALAGIGFSGFAGLSRNMPEPVGELQLFLISITPLVLTVVAFLCFVLAVVSWWVTEKQASRNLPGKVRE